MHHTSFTSTSASIFGTARIVRVRCSDLFAADHVNHDLEGGYDSAEFLDPKVPRLRERLQSVPGKVNYPDRNTILPERPITWEQ